MKFPNAGKFWIEYHRTNSKDTVTPMLSNSTYPAFQGEISIHANSPNMPLKRPARTMVWALETGQVQQLLKGYQIITVRQDRSCSKEKAGGGSFL